MLVTIRCLRRHDLAWADHQIRNTITEFKILRFRMSLLEPSGLGPKKKIGETNCPNLRGQTSTGPISNNFATASAKLGDSELRTGGCRGKGPTSGMRKPLITLRTLSSVVKDCHSDRNRLQVIMVRTVDRMLCPMFMRRPRGTRRWVHCFSAPELTQRYVCHWEN